MKRLVFISLFVLSAGIVFADAATDKMKVCVDSYRKGVYGTAVKNGLEALDFMYQSMMNTVLKYLPELKDYKTTETNYIYQFSSELGSITHSFQLWKKMEGPDASVKVTFNNSLFELNRIHSLYISMDYMKSGIGYEKMAVTNADTIIPLLKDGNTAFVYYAFETVDTEIFKGLLIRVDIALKKNPDEKTKKKIWLDIVKQVIGKTKAKSIQLYMN
ncbi:MAG: hypothetical protein A2Y33_15430 [Spirochaetes bacterium GWF1_51_8]|nr:MAG: hypothetical protein A2Y33_15430 [Spirochaetes bacterium GWF1_51_8]